MCLTSRLGALSGGIHRCRWLTSVRRLSPRHPQEQAIREFGHTFLLPIGVRKTQEELDAVVGPFSSLAVVPRVGARRAHELRLPASPTRPLTILRLSPKQTRTPSPTPPSNAEDNRPSRHGHHGAHDRNPAHAPHPGRELSAELPDVDGMRDLDDDLDDEDAESEEEDGLDEDQADDEDE